MTTTRAETDFDHQSIEWLAERHRHNAEFREKCPVVWNRHYGGYWYITGYEEVAQVSRNSETFSPLFIDGAERAPDGIHYIGIMGIPRGPDFPPIGIAESVGNKHAALRRVINPFMLPAAAAKDRPFLEHAAAWFMAQKVADGQMDLVLDFASPVPAIWTMKMLGLPAEHWNHYAEYFHAAAAYGQDTPEYKQGVARTPEMVGEAIEFFEQRRKNPGDDLLSQLVMMEVDGEKLSNEDLVAMVWNLIGGGLDTTTSLTSMTLVYLAEHPDLRQRLADDPELLPPACEEFLRWTCVQETLSRTCTKDTILGGQEIKRGDPVIMSWLGANFDSKVFDRPEEVDIERAPNPHLSFGVGAHRCIGLHSTRVLFNVMLREVLARIPDYQIDRDRTEFYRGNPLLYGVVKMPVTFTPGKPMGIEQPF